MGLWWPDADSGTLRTAAGAWRTFATAVDDVRTPVNNTAASLIHNNSGEAIDAFEVFWGRYAKGRDGGWLSDLSQAAGKLADALEKFADVVDHAITKLWTQIGIDAAAIAGSITLAFFTAGAFSAGVAAVADGIIAMGEALAVSVSEEVATIAAGTLVSAAFGGVQSVTVDLAVAQPLAIATGMQQHLSLDEVDQAAKDGVISGAMTGGGVGVLKAGVDSAFSDGVPLMLYPPSLRPDLVDLGPAARSGDDIPCVNDPVDVATGAMLMRQTDVTLPGVLPLVFERTHLSSYRGGVCFGPVWASTLDECCQIDGEGVVFAAADGMRLVYPVPRPGEPTMPVKGGRLPLVWDGAPEGTIEVTDPDTGVVRTFTAAVPSATPGVFHLPLNSLRDRGGNRIDIERDAHGVPVGLRHSGGYYLAVDTAGPRVTALRLLDEPPSRYGDGPDRDAGTVVVRYGYDKAGNLTEVVNSSGSPLRFAYDDQGRICRWTDRNGTWFGYVYDERGRVIRTEGVDGILSATFDYDDTTRTTTYTDSQGNRSTYGHTTDGQVAQETDPLGNTTRTWWDAHGDKPLAITDPLGRTTTYAYDAYGRPTQVTLPDGSVARAAYNALGLPEEVVEPGGATWRRTYDDRGNLLTTTDPAGAETRRTYDDGGRLTSVTDALGGVRAFTANPAGLPVAVTDELGRVTSVRRDPFGRVAEITDPLGRVTRLTWTLEGRPRRRDHPDGTHESWTWDGEGNLLSHTDQVGNVTRHTPGPFDLPAQRLDPDGAAYAFAYDTELRLTGVTNPQGRTWSYVYDAAGRLTGETDFNGRTLHYGHDASGALTSRTNGAGETLGFTRDALGRVTEQRASNGEATTYAYGADGRPTRISNPDAEVLTTYDPLGRTLTEAVNGRVTRYAYDPLGRRVLRTTPSGLTSRWTYDPAGQAATLATDAGTLAFSYDAAGRESRRRIGPDVTLTQTWDDADRLATQSLTAGSVAARAIRQLQFRSYAYRADGYVEEIRELTSGTRHFTLDPVGRITTVRAHGWTETYAYDAAGNLTTARAPGHPAPGERQFDGMLIRTAGNTAYEHDAQGRVVRRTRKLLNGQRKVWTYSWSPEDRLTELVAPDGERWQYHYDPLGRRISKQRVLDGDRVADREVFTWDGTTLAERVSSDGATTTWDHAQGTHRPLTQTDHHPVPQSEATRSLAALAEATDRPPARFHAIITDAVGTPMELVTPSGDLAWQQRTTSWGTRLPPATTTTPAVTCPLRFPGQYADAESGLHYNYFRYYEPEIGSYLAEDPLGLSPAPNSRRYVINAFTHADPTGLAPQCGDILGNPSTLAGWIPSEVPEESKAVLQDIREFGVEAQGAGPQRMGPSLPKTFSNSGKGGAYKLPGFDSTGKPIRYLEWGTVQSAQNPKWGGERIVTGSDGSAYYTPTHYQTFIVMEAGR
ncbi:DUF6531 domain-containing protein [Streptomyces sp. PTM05]|uniref:DUF6531 domain-containing protein n=1 Tax=Streptantibioticus parmotrematis TaxID=2873249 RepID=A0ABS7QVU2_9ACTN|nr:DUF6531 domain-containing protein [Streptantibioticus parmotrematis]